MGINRAFWAHTRGMHQGYATTDTYQRYTSRAYIIGMYDGHIIPLEFTMGTYHGYIPSNAPQAYITDIHHRHTLWAYIMGIYHGYVL